MADEFFYGVTLKGENSVITWNPLEKAGEEDFSDRAAHKLIVKQLLLGVEAKADEFNVVEVETIAQDEKIKIPIAVLKVGETRCCQSFLEFPDAPVTFKLIQGSGPVHIHGHHLLGDIDAGDMEDIEEEECCIGDEDDDSDNEIKAEEDDEPKPKKLKTSKGGVKAEKNGKKK